MTEQRKGERRLATILFTDLVGSTQLKEALGDSAATSLIARHHALVREILDAFSEGQEIETAGDSFLILFGKPSDAVEFALRLQSRLRQNPGGEPTLQDRIGIHVGEVLAQPAAPGETSKGISGIHVDICARIMSLGKGDQILITRFAFDTARSVMKREAMPGLGELHWINHGLYQLKGIEEPIGVCEVGEAMAAVLAAPINSDKAHRCITTEEELVLGWRPALGQPVPNTQWTLEQKLGEGGFGEVWLGQHGTLKERRVFKFCFRADRVRALRREVTLFRVLKERVGHHPNIVGIQEVFFDEPPYYIVMDYASGQDLRNWYEAAVGTGQVPMATRLEIVAQVAEGLDAAHRAGVIHRDVKPSNILVHCGGRPKPPRPSLGGNNRAEEHAAAESEISVKLTDFGIGQVMSEQALAGITQAGFTQTMLSPGSSSYTGTQMYMAPELVAGRPASPQSDIYSLGVVLYQLLIGDLTMPLTTDWAHRITDPLLKEDLAKCFAGNPEERFSSAGELSRNLRQIGQRRQERAASLKSVSRRRLFRWATVATLALISLGASFWYAMKAARPAPAKLIYVFPFAMERTAPTNAYLGPALTGEFISALKNVRQLKASLFPTNVLEDTRTVLAAVGASLLEGTIKATNETLAMQVRLVDPTGGKEIWSKSYQRAITDLLGLPEELARHIATGLKVPSRRRREDPKPTSNPHAYLAYLRGKFHVRQQITQENNSLAIQMLERAVDLDPSFGLAKAELSRAYFDGWYFLNPTDKVREKKAIRVAEEACLLAPYSGDAHYARALCTWSPSNQFPHREAIRMLRQALVLDAELEPAYFLLGVIYNHVGLCDEGFALGEKVLRQVNPLNADLRVVQANACLWSGRLQQGIERLRQLPPGNLHEIHLSYTAWGYVQLGQTNEAARFLDENSSAKDVGGIMSSTKALVFAATGERRKAEEQIAQAAAQRTGFGHFHHAAYNLAGAYALLGEAKNAIYWFRAAVEDGFNCYPLFLSDRNLLTLSGLPEFQELLRQEEQKFNALKAEFGRP